MAPPWGPGARALRICAALGLLPQAVLVVVISSRIQCAPRMEPLQAHPHAPARLCVGAPHRRRFQTTTDVARTLLRTRHHFNKENSQSGFLLFEISSPSLKSAALGSLLAVANNPNNRHFSAVMTFRHAAMYSFVACTRSIPWRTQRISLGGGNRRAGTWRLAREHDAAAPFVLGLIERSVGAGGETV